MTNIKKINVLYLIDQLLPGGTENQIALIYKRFQSSDIDIKVATLNSAEFQPKFAEDLHGISFSNSLPQPLKSMRMLYDLIKYIDLVPIHIVQSHFPESSIYASLAVKLARSKPVWISTRRNLYHWVEDEPIVFKAMSVGARWADCVIVNSHLAQIECSVREAIDLQKIVRIPNAIDIEKFKPMLKMESRRRLGLDLFKKTVGVVANWRLVKGLDNFLLSCALIANKLVDVQFVLAGSGGAIKNNLMQMARDLMIDKQTVFLDKSPDIPTVINALDVAVQPSRSESFSNVLLEYMACGRPVVATRVGEADRVIQDGRDGILVDSEDPVATAVHVLRLLANPKEAEALGERAKQRVRVEFGIDRMVRDYRCIYRNLLLRHKNL